MVRTIIKPSAPRIDLSIPIEYIGEEIEILVFPVQKQESISKKTINELMEGSITQSLIGAIPYPDMTLDEIRSLRLQKYESTN